MTRAACAEIDLQALAHNVRRVRESAPGSRIMAVIKADGYGHGLLRVARALRDVDAFGVASLDEALELRDQGISHPIVLLEGFADRNELSLIARHQLDTVIHHDAQIALLEGASLEQRIMLWLKVDTGMHRLGFHPSAIPEAWHRLNACPLAGDPVRLMTHLACADDPADPMTDRQLDSFDAAINGLDTECSIANSAAILGKPHAHREWVRPGLMLYGASPFLEGSGLDLDLRPVMTLRARLIAVNHCRRGDSIGYGASWTCPDDMPVGVVAAGYGDGYPRHAPPDTPVLLRDRQVPLVGRVCMDMILVDLRACPDAAIGDDVILWGAGLPVEEIARHATTIPYELLCGVTRRVRMIEIGKRDEGGQDTST